MPSVITNKYNVTVVNPKTGEETVSVATEEVGGISIEQSFGPVWKELGLELLTKELIHTTEEQKIAPDEDGAVPNQSPEIVQRRVIQNPQQGQLQRPQQPQRVPHPNHQRPVGQVPMDIPEKIIQHGDVKLKLVGDKVYIEEWVDKNGCEGYKVISEEGKEVTNKVTILHKEWVELKEPEPEPEPEPKLSDVEPVNPVKLDPTPDIAGYGGNQTPKEINNSFKADDDNEAESFGDIVDNLI